MILRDTRIVILLFILDLSLNAVGVLAADQHRSRIVAPITVKGLEQLIHQRNGKVLLLNVWATWCKPCIEEFPDLIRLHRTYRDSAVDIVAISVDYPDEVDSKILPFLDSLNVSFKVFVADLQKQEDLINALNPSWSGAVPATFVYDAHGQRTAFLLGKKNFEIFKEALDNVE